VIGDHGQLGRLPTSDNVGEALFKKSEMPFYTILLLCGYLSFLESAGFLISTVGLNFLLILLFKVRRIPVLIAFPVCMTVAIYWIFAKLLLVPLPEGLFYF
jgi:hypothetical protein